MKAPRTNPPGDNTAPRHLPLEVENEEQLQTMLEGAGHISGESEIQPEVDIDPHRVIRLQKEGSGLQKASPPKKLPNTPEHELSPDDQEYRHKLAAIRNEIAELPDCGHRQHLAALFEAVCNLPAGEVARLAKTAEKKTLKWQGDIPKVPPAKFQDRPASQKLPGFLREHYLSLFESGITPSHLDILDSPCAAAIRHWELKYGKLPDDIQFQNLKEKFGPVPENGKN